MNFLDKIPGFGYESKSCFSDKHIYTVLQNAPKKADKSVAEVAEKNVAFDSPLDKKVEAHIAKANTIKVFGYFPIIGIGIGIKHIHQACSEKKHFSAAFIARGVLEMLGLGFLFLIPDLILKCVREQKAKQESKKHFEAEHIKPTRQEIFAGKVASASEEFLISAKKSRTLSKNTNLEKNIKKYIQTKKKKLCEIAKRADVLSNPNAKDAFLASIKKEVLNDKNLSKFGLFKPEDAKKLQVFEAMICKEGIMVVLNSEYANEFFSKQLKALEAELGKAPAKELNNFVKQMKAAVNTTLSASVDQTAGLLSESELARIVQKELAKMQGAMQNLVNMCKAVS